MNCNNCGAKLNAGDVFCPNCGAKNEMPNPNMTAGTMPDPAAGTGFQAAPAADAVKKPFLGMSGKNLIIAVGCVVVTVVLIIVLLCAIFGGNSAKEAVKDYYEAIEDCDADDLMDTVPKEYLKHLMEQNDLSKKELEKEIQKYLDNYYDDYDEIKVTFQGQEKMDEEDFAEYLDSDGFEDIQIKKATQYELKVRYQSDHGDKVQTKTEEFVVFKYKGSWYSMDAMILVTMAAYF
ncbi:MAG: zinc-ribbon domain-containing protein [Ruminococcus sp.]